MNTTNLENRNYLFKTSAMEILYFLTGKIYHSHFHYAIANVSAKMVLMDGGDIFRGRIINGILAFGVL